MFKTGLNRTKRQAKAAVGDAAAGAGQPNQFKTHLNATNRTDVKNVIAGHGAVLVLREVNGAIQLSHIHKVSSM